MLVEFFYNQSASLAFLAGLKATHDLTHGLIARFVPVAGGQRFLRCDQSARGFIQPQELPAYWLITDAATGDLPNSHDGVSFLAVTYLPVDGTGRLDPDQLRAAVTPRTILVSIMHANNEVGTVQPIEECARIARERGVFFHTDAAQSVGKIATKVDELGVDLLSVAGHKLYAPKGVGALFVRRGVRLEPLIHGAGHENGRRAGTESALLAVGLGKPPRSPQT